MRNNDPRAEIVQMQREAHEEQEKELVENFNQLSLERRAQVVILSRRLVEEKKERALFDTLWKAFNQLNDEGQKLVLAYLEALAANPKYLK